MHDHDHVEVYTPRYIRAELSFEPPADDSGWSFLPGSDEYERWYRSWRSIPPVSWMWYRQFDNAERFWCKEDGEVVSYRLMPPSDGRATYYRNRCNVVDESGEPDSCGWVSDVYEVPPSVRCGSTETANGRPCRITLHGLFHRSYRTSTGIEAFRPCRNHTPEGLEAREERQKAKEAAAILKEEEKMKMEMEMERSGSPV